MPQIRQWRLPVTPVVSFVHRPGYANTVAITYPASIGEVEHVEMLTVPETLQVLAADESRDSVRASAQVSHASLKSWPRIEALAPKRPGSGRFLKGLSEKLRPGRSCECKDDPDFTIASVSLRDVRTKKRKIWLPVAAGIKTIGVSSKRPATFYLTDSDSVHENILRKVCRVLKPFIPFAMLFSDAKPVTCNLTRAEKVLYFTAAAYFNLMMDTFYYGWSETYLNFESDLSESPVRVLSDYFTTSRTVTLIASAVLLTLLTAFGKRLSKSWKRRVEDRVSFWEGLRPVYVCWKAFLYCLSRRTAAKYEDTGDNRYKTAGQSSSENLERDGCEADEALSRRVCKDFDVLYPCFSC